ncbi:MAG: type II secretion system secretin GspD [Magnetococcales bacterium]|nr:type II secretion system secretin GspD [Magnetococcales bacterium]
MLCTLSRASAIRWLGLFTLLIVLIGLPFSDIQARGTLSDDEMVELNFQEVDLRQVIRFVAELTGENIIIDDKVKGKVSVVTPAPVSLPEVRRIFDSILNVMGYTGVRQGPVIKILPLVEGRTEGSDHNPAAALPPEDEIVVSQLIRLDHISASALVAIVKPMIHPWGLVTPHAQSNTLVVTDNATTILKVIDIIRALDQPEELAVRKMFKLKFAAAKHVEKLLNIFYADYNSQYRKGLPNIKTFSDDRTNTLLVVAPEDRIAEIKQILAKLDQRTVTGQGNLHVYYPNNGKAKVIAKVLNDLLGKVKGGAAEEQPLNFLRKVSVVGEETTNTLVIAATPEDYETLRPVIEGLDIPRLQVHVEAIVIEVTSERAASFGVEWRFADNYMNGNDTAPFGGSTFGSMNTVAANPLANSGLSMGLVKGTITLGSTTYANLGALITALQNDTDTNILATPNILTMDNEEALIHVGQNVPFLTGKQSSSGNDIISTVDRKDVGLTLKVTPQILEGSRLLLKVFQEDSSLATTISTGVDPAQGVVTNTRSIQTTVTLNNDEMVVLGGLLREDTSEVVSQVPCLGSIAALGELFKSSSSSGRKSNLMVFIKPVIINSYARLLDISRDKYKKLKKNWVERSSDMSVIVNSVKPELMPLELDLEKLLLPKAESLPSSPAKSE